MLEGMLRSFQPYQEKKCQNIEAAADEYGMQVACGEKVPLCQLFRLILIHTHPPHFFFLFFFFFLATPEAYKSSQARSGIEPVPHQ